MKLVKIPAKIGNKDVTIMTDRIGSVLPLLLNKKAMKMVKIIKNNFDDNVITIHGQKLNISFTASGHYFIAMSRTNKAITHLVENKSTENILLSISRISSKSTWGEM